MKRLEVFGLIARHGFAFGLMIGAVVGAFAGLVIHVLFAIVALFQDGWGLGAAMLLSVIALPFGLFGGLFIGLVLGGLAGLIDGLLIGAITAHWFFPLHDIVIYHRTIRYISIVVNGLLTWLIAPKLVSYLIYPRFVTTIMPIFLAVVCTWKMITKITEDYERKEQLSTRDAPTFPKG